MVNWWGTTKKGRPFRFASVPVWSLVGVVRSLKQSLLADRRLSFEAVWVLEAEKAEREV
jgi:hypothetical protein